MSEQTRKVSSLNGLIEALNNPDVAVIHIDHDILLKRGHSIYLNVEALKKARHRQQGFRSETDAN